MRRRMFLALPAAACAPKPKPFVNRPLVGFSKLRNIETAKAMLADFKRSFPEVIARLKREA